MPTGPGASDSEGIYQYGEDDSEGLFSDLLNRLASTVSTKIGTLRKRPPYHWANSTERGAQAGMQTGDEGTQLDTGVVYKYFTSWKPWTSDWISWATAPTNLVVGTGGAAATTQRYRWYGGLLEFDCSYTLGSSGQSVGTNPTINLPAAAALKMLGPLGGLLRSEGIIYDALPTPAYPSFAKANLIGSTTTVRLQTYNGAINTITATSPITFGAGDIISVQFQGIPV